MKFPSLLPLLLGLVLAGCATTAPKLSSTPAVPSNPFTELQKNLTATQVLALVGKPSEINPFKIPGLEAKGLASEIWIYHRTVAQTNQQVALTTKDVPYFDPFIQQIRMIKESVYSTETITVIEVFELLMIEGQLIEWKSHRETKRAIY